MKTESQTRRAVRPRTVLIVEDDETVRTTLAGLLEDDGLEAMTASTLTRARYILFESRHPVGVLVLDLSLTDGDGEALLADLYENDEKSVPAVILSADRQRAIRLADAYGIPFVTKPFDLQEVAATVAVSFENDVRPHLRHPNAK